jgi:hypothetical protein
MVFPSGSGVGVGVLIGIDVGDFVGIAVEVVMGEQATNNKMPSNIIK